jgi:hypothetical protein
VHSSTVWTSALWLERAQRAFVQNAPRPKTCWFLALVRPARFERATCGFEVRASAPSGAQGACSNGMGAQEGAGSKRIVPPSDQNGGTAAGGSTDGFAEALGAWCGRLASAGLTEEAGVAHRALGDILSKRRGG